MFRFRVPTAVVEAIGGAEMAEYRHQQLRLLGRYRFRLRIRIRFGLNSSSFCAQSPSVILLLLLFLTILFRVDVCVWGEESRFRNEKLIGVQVDAAGNVLPIIPAIFNPRIFF